MNFNMRGMNFTCLKCDRNSEYAKANVTSHYAFYFTWTCVCGHKCECILPFEEAVKMMPPSPMLGVNAFDRQLCKQAGILMED